MKTQQLKLFETPGHPAPKAVAQTWFQRMRDAVNRAPEPKRITHLQRKVLPRVSPADSKPLPTGCRQHFE